MRSPIFYPTSEEYGQMRAFESDPGPSLVSIYVHVTSALKFINKTFSFFYFNQIVFLKLKYELVYDCTQIATLEIK